MPLDACAARYDETFAEAISRALKRERPFRRGGSIRTVKESIYQALNYVYELIRHRPSRSNYARHGEISRDSFTLTFLKAKRGVFLELDSSWNLLPRRTIAALRRNDIVSDVSKHTYRRDRRYVTRQTQKVSEREQCDTRGCVQSRRRGADPIGAIFRRLIGFRN